MGRVGCDTPAPSETRATTNIAKQNKAFIVYIIVLYIALYGVITQEILLHI